MEELQRWLREHSLPEAEIKITEIVSEDGAPALRVEVIAVNNGGPYGEFDVVAPV